MKKIFIIIAAASVVLAANSCNKENVSSMSGEPMVVKFTAQVADTRAMFKPGSMEDGAAVPVVWNGGENLDIFVNEYADNQGVQNKVYANIEEGLNESETATWTYDFSNETYVTKSESYTFYTFCPGNSVRAFYNNGEHRVKVQSLPSEQTPKTNAPEANSCDPEAMFFYSVSQKYGDWPETVALPPFKHMTAYGCITLGTGIPDTETVKKVTVTANKGQNLAGNAWYYYDSDTWVDYTGSGDGIAPTETITINTSSNEYIWFGCRPTTALTSLTFEVTTVEGNTYKVVKEELKGKNFEAGKVALMTINGFEKVEDESVTYVWEASTTGSGFILGDFAKGEGEGLTWNGDIASQTFDYGEPSLTWTVEATTSSSYNINDGAKSGTQRLKIEAAINPFKFTINTGSSYKVKKVSVHASAVNSGCRQITIKVGNETLVENSELPVALTLTNNEFCGELSEAVQGDVSVDISTIEGEAAKAIYLYKVILTMEKVSSQEQPSEN